MSSLGHTYIGASVPGGSTARSGLPTDGIHLRALTAALLRSVKLPLGATALDLGCGPGGALGALSDHVGHRGHVVGVDVDPRNVVAARAFAKERRLINVQVASGDAARTGLPDSSFDLVHARRLLAYVHSPERVVGEIVRLVRPGGWVAVLEPDTGLRICHPPHPGLSRLAELLAAARRLEGSDPYVARRLTHLFATAGLVDVGVRARAEVCPPGHPQRSLIPDLVHGMRTEILAAGLSDEQELELLDATARGHLDNPRTRSTPVTYFLFWARKPATAR